MSTEAVVPQSAELLAPNPLVAAGVPLAGARVGSTIIVEDLASGKSFTYGLVERHEAAPKFGLLSIDSPVGMALRSRQPGEVVTATTPRGHRRLRVVSVS